MKKCIICKKEKNALDFNRKSRNADGLQNKCRECSSELAKKHYLKNRTREINRIRIRKELILCRFKEYKGSLTCQRCDEDEFCCMDFHHRDPTKKDFNVSVAARKGYSWKRILKEIAKCDVVCSNCHRKIHAGILNCGVIQR